MNEEYRVSYDIVAYHHSLRHHHSRPRHTRAFLQTISRHNLKYQRRSYNFRTTRSLYCRGRSSHRPAHHGRMMSRPDSFYGLHFRQIHERDDRVDTVVPFVVRIKALRLTFSSYYQSPWLLLTSYGSSVEVWLLVEIFPVGDSSK